jgi:general secretion pathway protein G
MVHISCCGAIILLVSIWTQAAEPATQPSLTPKEVSLKFVQAVAADDMDAVRALSVGTDAEFQMIKNLADYALTLRNFDAALHKHFGGDIKLPTEIEIQAVPSTQAFDDALDEKIDGDVATLQPKTSSSQVAATSLRKVAGQWKVDLAELSKGGETAGFFMMLIPSHTAAMGLATKNIESNNYKTAEEAIKEMYDFTEDAGADFGVSFDPKAREDQARSVMSEIRAALAKFKTANGRYPTSDEGIQALVANPANLPHWEQDMERVRWDPWFHLFHYRSPGKNGAEYDLYSTGPSGKDGADDNISSTEPSGAPPK